MSQAPQIDYDALWKYVTQHVKTRSNLPAFWRALEAGRPITIDADRLVVGFGVSDMHQSGLLLQTQNKNLIEQVLEQATRKRLTLHVIQGESLQDWESAKTHQEEATRLQQESATQFRQRVEGGGNWDAVGEQLVRKVAALQHRGLASVQSRFLDEAVGILAEAYGRLMPDTPSETDERNYSRALERLGERVLVPAAVIGYLVEERVKRGQREA